MTNTNQNNNTDWNKNHVWEKDDWAWGWRFPQDLAVELSTTARSLVADGKGILAADESTSTIQKRFDNIGVENNESNRAAYRTMLFTTPNLNKYISGVILFEETLNQNATSGKKFVDILTEQNIIPGIKVDTGVVNLWGTDDEKTTCGLDNLGKRCAEFYAKGARFAKWRAVFTIDPFKNKPTELAIMENARGLARYAAICQENRLVPIVEPEILSDGSWSIETGARVAEKVWFAVFSELNKHNVLLEGILLKPNMITGGNEFAEKYNPEQVAFFTIRTLLRTVPAAVPGICFLSGGQSEESASLHLNAINSRRNLPWKLTFSFGRALQSSALKAWSGNNKNFEAAQRELFERAKANGEAFMGTYKGGVGGQVATGSLFEKKYIY